MTENTQTLRSAMGRAEAMRRAAIDSGDQSYGAVVIKAGRIVGAAPSRVITANDPTAHAEMEAIRDAVKRLDNADLSGCTLVSTSHPCAMCETAAHWAGIEALVHGTTLIEAGRPRYGGC